MRRLAPLSGRPWRVHYNFYHVHVRTPLTKSRGSERKHMNVKVPMSTGNNNIWTKTFSFVYIISVYHPMGAPNPRRFWHRTVAVHNSLSTVFVPFFWRWTGAILYNIGVWNHRGLERNNNPTRSKRLAFQDSLAHGHWLAGLTDDGFVISTTSNRAIIVVVPGQSCCYLVLGAVTIV